jgi:hypothetical protein
MPNVTVATFVIGSEAADRVRRQLGVSAAYLTTRAGRASGDSLSEIAHGFDYLLSTSSEGFDTMCNLPETKPLRVIWHIRQKTAGILYVASANELQTISLVLSGVDPKADVLAIEEVGRVLSPLDAYFESLAVVRFARRPMLATFCSRTGGLDQGVDAVQLAFAGVFFQRCGLPASQPHKRDRQAASKDSSRLCSNSARLGTSHFS